MKHYYIQLHGRIVSDYDNYLDAWKALSKLGEGEILTEERSQYVSKKYSRTINETPRC